MSDDLLPTERTHAVAFEKSGIRQITTPDQLVDLADVRRLEHNITRSLDKLARYQVIEIPGTRRGEWEYREHCLTVDPWEILAYVGDLRGADAVRASNEFLEAAGRAYAQGAPAIVYDPEQGRGL